MNISSELDLYNINKADIESTISIPINIHMMRIENLIIDKLACNHIKPDVDIFNLFYSLPLIKQYIRMKIATTSKYNKLFRETSNKLDYKNAICFNRYIGNDADLLNNVRMANKAFANLSNNELAYINNLLKDIWFRLTTNQEALRTLKDNVVLFSLGVNNLNIYSLGNIGVYRLREIEENIIKWYKVVDQYGVYGCRILPINSSTVERICIDPY